MTPEIPTFLGERHNARSLALQVLIECERALHPVRGEPVRPDRFIQDVLDRHLSSEPARGLSVVDRRLATHLAYGVLRRRGTLQALLQPLINREPEQVESWLWDALMLGAYQLCILTQIPPHAALNETVELASHFGRARAKGFLNGVLRACSTLVTPDRTSGPAADALPLEGGVYRRLTRPALPDPAARPVEYISAAFGLPGWLAARWFERLGQHEAIRLAFWFAGPAPLTLRTNILKISREALLERLVAAGLKAEAGQHPQAIRLREHAVVRELPGYAEGLFCVQDEASMRVANALEPAPGQAILDLCSAPGGKTTHLAELVGGRGRIIACDIDENRLATVRELAGRLEHECISTVLLDPSRSQDVPAGPFDAVLVDVPCSNTGVLGRRPEARWRILPEDVRLLTQIQRRLLQVAIERTRAGGVIVYSTCSIEPEENRELVRSVLAEVGGAVREAEEESQPGRRTGDTGHGCGRREGSDGRSEGVRFTAENAESAEKEEGKQTGVCHD